MSEGQLWGAGRCSEVLAGFIEHRSDAVRDSIEGQAREEAQPAELRSEFSHCVQPMKKALVVKDVDEDIRCIQSLRALYPRIESEVTS
eukprot:6482353-Amphidinium_carterae.1